MPFFRLLFAKVVYFWFFFDKFNTVILKFTILMSHAIELINPWKIDPEDFSSIFRILLNCALSYCAWFLLGGFNSKIIYFWFKWVFRSIFSSTAILKLLGRIFDHFGQRLTFWSNFDFSGQSLTFWSNFSADRKSRKTLSLSPEKAVWTFKTSFLSLKINKLRSQHFLIF